MAALTAPATADFLAPPTREDYVSLSALRQKLAIEQHDVAAFVPVARLYIREALERADALEESNPESAHALLNFAKAMAYNVAADTWPGWGDATEIKPELMAVGFEAAMLNLEISERLGLANPKLGVAHWVIGAHYLARGDFDDARREFEKSLVLSDDRLLIEGYLALTEYLQTDSAEARATLHARRDAIKANAKHEWEWKQLETAERAFTR